MIDDVFFVVLCWYVFVYLIVWYFICGEILFIFG